MIIKNASRPAVACAAMMLAAMFAGCATVKYSAPGKLADIVIKGVEGAEYGQVVTIDTYGYYMFWTIPLCSGDLRWDPAKKDIRGGVAFFSDQVGFYELQDALLKIAESRDCDLAEVSFNDSDESFAGVSYIGAVGTCFGESRMSVSAILVPRKTAKK